MSGSQSHEFSVALDDWKSVKAIPLRFHQLQNVADQLIRRHFDWLLDQTVHMVFNAPDFGKLLPLWHVVVDDSQAAVQRHGDGHA